MGVVYSKRVSTTGSCCSTNECSLSEKSSADVSNASDASLINTVNRKKLTEERGEKSIHQERREKRRRRRLMGCLPSADSISHETDSTTSHIYEEILHHTQSNCRLTTANRFRTTGNLQSPDNGSRHLEDLAKCSKRDESRLKADDVEGRLCEELMTASIFDERTLAELVRLNMKANNVDIPGVYNRHERRNRQRHVDQNSVRQPVNVTSQDVHLLQTLSESVTENDSRIAGQPSKNFPHLDSSRTEKKSNGKKNPDVVGTWSTHYWYRHRHRASDERRAMRRVSDWLWHDVRVQSIRQPPADDQLDNRLTEDWTGVITEQHNHYHYHHHHHHHYHNYCCSGRYQLADNVCDNELRYV